MILAESKWFTPDDGQVGNALTKVFKKYKDFVRPAKQLKNVNKKNFSFEKMVEILKGYDNKYVPEFAVQVELKMPELELPKLTKL